MAEEAATADAGSTPSLRASGLVCAKYEVWGKVQHVFMRKFTKTTADGLGVTGYVENTDAKTVRGECCGPREKLERFKEWLRTEGSPKARVDRAEFSDERAVEASPFEGFQVRRVRLANGKQWAD